MRRAHPVGIGLQQLDGEVELAEDHAAQPLRVGLAGEQRRPAVAGAVRRVALRAVGAALQLAFGEGDGDADADHRERAGEGRHNGAMPPRLPSAPWWTVRRAANRKPATYRCPFCGHQLPALSEHMLIAPEGDTRRRRHAHTKCVVRARERGQLVMRDEWLRTQPRPTPWWRRLLRHTDGPQAP